MVMGPTHAMSGAALWLAGSAAADIWFGIDQSSAELVVGTIACAGAALYPDIDCAGKVTENKGGSTVARSFGVASLLVAEVVERLCYWFYLLTKSKQDKKRKNGHRTFTHTAVHAGLVGVGTGALAAQFGKPAVIAILFVLTGLAVRGLLAETVAKKGWVVTTAVALAASYGMYRLLPDTRQYWILGLAMGIGCFIHILGDMITKMGSPLFFPIPIKGRRWNDIGLPNAIALRAGGKEENRILLPILTVLVVIGMFWNLPEVQNLIFEQSSSGKGAAE
ncbi:metal-dependent hydrolase [Glycomyces sp. TRM65418]|uniref:metal-dependent hydrolase n=1 Tax=Glycomyces sp. TRM65418 TaxID=2867006 RepID=UPI001CE4DF71|nr:metal-dependent hydrolase [Glycomyces sp. TRM65418]MCC3765482.1 metal-dependent hydrolase [Glycomyces sp. TRM65418]QZD55090.1 metal-dependent hydrolase [Glycomyces sp. TRM65418]